MFFFCSSKVSAIADKVKRRQGKAIEVVDAQADRQNRISALLPMPGPSPPAAGSLQSRIRN